MKFFKNLWTKKSKSEAAIRPASTASDKNGTRTIDLSKSSASLVFVNKVGDFVIETDFFFGSRFSEGLAHVSLDREWKSHGFINTSGELVIRLQKPIELEGLFSNGLAILRDRENDTRGAINQSGEIVIPFGKLGNLSCRFSEGLCGATKGKGRNESWGFVDKTGEFVITPRFDYVDPMGFSEGLIRVGDGRYQSGYADLKGNVVIPTNYYQCTQFSDGLAGFSYNNGGLIGLFDTLGTEVMPPKFKSFSPFSEKLAVAAIGNDSKYGYVDRTGDYVIQPRFDQANNFTDGVAPVVEDGTLRFIDNTGREIVDTQIEISYLADSFGDGLYPIKLKA